MSNFNNHHSFNVAIQGTKTFVANFSSNHTFLAAINNAHVFILSVDGLPVFNTFARVNIR